MSLHLIKKNTICGLCIFLLAPISITFGAINPWGGSYIGLFTGSNFGIINSTTSTGSVRSSSYFPSDANINAVNNAGASINHSNNMIVGIQAGHDWTSKQMVYGIVADYSKFALYSSENVNNATYPDNSGKYSISTSVKTNWLFTLRGRLGYSTMLHWPSLLYLTGGMALTEITVANSFSDNSSLAGIGGNSTSSNQIGWTIGTGIKFASSKNTSIDIEYLYLDMPSARTSSNIFNSAGGFGIPEHSLTNDFSSIGKLSASLLKIGFNYHFDA